MIRSLWLPVVAGLMLLFAANHVLTAQKPVEQAAPPSTPAMTKYARCVAASGLVEPQNESIAIGSHLPGIVAHVYVKVGQRVRPGDPLFALDQRQVEADLRVKEAQLQAAEAELARLEQMPRPEDLPPLEARVREAEALVAERRDAYERNALLAEKSAVGQGDLVSSRTRLAAAQAQLEAAKAEEARMRAGSWEADKLVSRAAVERARAEVAQLRTQAERHTVLTPAPDRGGHGAKDGKDVTLDVLQLNIRPGEAVDAASGKALLVLGDVSRRHVRVDIDEHDIPRFRTDAPAVGLFRGDTQREFALRFERLEPYVIPKRSLTGDAIERVDTRVLQVLYEIIAPAEPASLFVGQQMDVFIDVGPPP